MILYNMRYRGPFEYDKFVLNIFQIHNEVKMLVRKFNENEEGNLLDIYKDINQIYEYLTDKNSNGMKILLMEHKYK